MSAESYTPFEAGTRDRVVGIFVIGAVLLFLIGFVIPLVQRLNADEGIEFHTIIDQTYGIAVDATVSLRGVVIGKVTDMQITDDGMVRVDVALSPTYETFYTNGSRLLVNTDLGVSTILTGSGLILQPGGRQDSPMTPGGFIPTEAPQGISSLLEEIDLVQITDQVTDIIANVETITAGISANQDKIYRSLDNLEVVTASLAEVSRTLPGMVASVDGSLISMQGSLAGVDKLIANTDKDLQETLRNSVVLTEQAAATLAEAEVLFRESGPALRQLPSTLITTDLALQSLTRLTDQMSRSWLLGGSGDSAPATVPAGISIHPHDDSHYKNNVSKTVSKKEVSNEQE